MRGTCVVHVRERVDSNFLCKIDQQAGHYLLKVSSLAGAFNLYHFDSPFFRKYFVHSFLDSLCRLYVQAFQSYLPSELLELDKSERWQKVGSKIWDIRGMLIRDLKYIHKRISIHFLLSLLWPDERRQYEKKLKPRWGWALVEVVITFDFTFIRQVIATCGRIEWGNFDICSIESIAEPQWSHL